MNERAARTYDVFPDDRPFVDLAELTTALGFLFAPERPATASLTRSLGEVWRAGRSFPRRARSRPKGASTVIGNRRPSDPEGRIRFHFSDSKDLDHELSFFGGGLSVEPPSGERAATIHTTWAAFAAFFTNQKSAQLLFFDGDWSFPERRGGFFDYAEVAPFLRAIDARLPSPSGDPDPFRNAVNEASRRLGDIVAVERIAAPSQRDFRDRYALQGRPFVAVESAAGATQCKWSFDELIEAYGDLDNQLSDHPPVVYPIREFLRRVERGDPVHIKAVLPLVRPLRAKYRYPPYFREDAYFSKAQALIVAPADRHANAGYAATCWHRDWADNFLVQLIGTKKVHLAPPSDEHCFYSAHARATSTNVATEFSPVSPTSPDLAKYPAFRRARIIQCVLEPGDTLFLPCGWWHHVENISPSCGVNCWKIHPLSEVDIAPDGRRLHLVPKRLTENQFQAMKR